MGSTDLITIDLDILGGTPVFKGTRGPATTLFDYLEKPTRSTSFQNAFPR